MERETYIKRRRQATDAYILTSSACFCYCLCPGPSERRIKLKNSLSWFQPTCFDKENWGKTKQMHKG